MQQIPKIFAIASMTENRVIGRGNELVFRDSRDMKRFSKLTTGHTVVMGRKTFESLPSKYRPLPDRLNVVLTRNPAALADEEEVLAISDFESFLKACQSGVQKLPSSTIWVIGGAQLYTLALPWCDEIYLTHVHQELEGDAYFPEFEADFELEEVEEGQEFSFQRFVRKSRSNEKSKTVNVA